MAVAGSTVAARSLPFVIACGCAIAALSFGPRSAMGLFLAPMSEARGWSREAISLAIAVQNLVWGAAQPLAGMIADRYGTARVLSTGGILYALGLAGTAMVETGPMLQLTLGILIGLGLSCCSFAIVLAAFGRTVDPAHRSIALGAGTAAGSVGQFLFAPLSLGLIGGIGWQGALVALGALLLLVVPFSIAFVGRGTAPATGRDQSVGAAIGEAFGHGSYVLLGLGFFVCGFHLAFITAHLPPYLADLGLAPSWGAISIALIGLFNIVGAFAAGWLGQRLPKQKLLSAIYLARAAAIALFLLAPAWPPAVVAFSAAMGLLWLSTVPLTSGLVAVMFGPRYMGTLFGFVFLSHQIGSFLGVWMGGKLYDATGSYDLFWWVAIGLGVLAAALNWPISERPVDRLAAA